MFSGRIVRLICAACVTACLLAQSSVRPDGARIGPDDTITIAAFHCEEISKTWRVGNSGEIDLPMVGVIKAAGLTVEELERELKKRLDKFLRDPRVSVIVSEYRSGPVTMTGAVEQSGTKQLQGNKRLFDALMLAGGIKPDASAVTLTRRKEQGEIPHPEAHLTNDGLFWVARFPVSEVRDGRGAAANLAIRPDDVLAVETAPPKLVHIIGEVSRPGSVELATQPSVPLTKALAAVGGETRLASLKKVIIRRIGENGASTEVAIIDLSKIIQGKARDLDLVDGHIVIVPSNNLKNYLQTASLTALNSGVFSGLQILARF